MKQEPMVPLQGKVTKTIKNRIRLLVAEKDMNESEFVRKSAEDYLNGVNSTKSGQTVTADLRQVESRLDNLEHQVQKLQRSLGVMLEVILLNVSENRESVAEMMDELKNKELI